MNTMITPPEHVDVGYARKLLSRDLTCNSACLARYVDKTVLRTVFDDVMRDLPAYLRKLPQCKDAYADAKVGLMHLLSFPIVQCSLGYDEDTWVRLWAVVCGHWPYQYMGFTPSVPRDTNYVKVRKRADKDSERIRVLHGLIQDLEQTCLEMEKRVAALPELRKERNRLDAQARRARVVRKGS